MTRRGCRGQASVEALALVPALVISILLVVQLAVLVRGAFVAHERVRHQALAAGGTGITSVRATVEVPSLLPGVAPFRLAPLAKVLAP